MRIRKKYKLDQIKKQILETRIQYDKESNIRIIAEIITLVFKIYFHILMQFGNRHILPICLEGLSKYNILLVIIKIK
jgi:hypothetical protein